MTYTAEIYAVAVAAAGGFAYGFFSAEIFMIGFWARDRVKRFLRKRQVYKPKLQNVLISITTLLSIVLAMINFVMLFQFPVMVFKAATFIVDIDVVVTVSKRLLWLFVAIVGLLLSFVRYGKRDVIQRSLDKKDESLPTNVEVPGRKSEDFARALEAKEVAKLLCRFEQIRFVDHGNARLVEKYHFDMYKPPFVVFLNKDGSRVSIDGKDVFQGEEITSPESYAGLLQKVLEKYPSENS